MVNGIAHRNDWAPLQNMMTFRDGKLQSLDPETKPESIVDMFKKGKPPAKRPLLDPLKNFALKAKSKAKAASTIVQTVGTLGTGIIGSRLEGLVSGEPSKPVLSWLRSRKSAEYTDNVKNLLQMVSGKAENSFGLNLEQMVEAEEGLYKMLSPIRDARGIKRPPELLTKIANCEPQASGAPRTAFVFLTKKLEKQADHISKEWDKALKDPATMESPFLLGEADRHVFDVLKKKYEEGRFPVYVDLDGDLIGYSTAEYLLKEQVHSLVEQHNQAGDGFKKPQDYYKWLTTRMTSYNETLDPYFKKTKPRVHSSIEAIKSDLSPPWLGGDESGLGPTASKAGVERAHSELSGLLQTANRAGNVSGLCDFADTVVGLDQDLSVGVETHWIRFLREIGSDRRQKFLANLGTAWADLNMVGPKDDQICNKTCPDLMSFEGSPARMVRLPYDRAMAVGEAVDHTLDGLSPGERRTFLSDLKKQIVSKKDKFNDREMRVRELGPYSGIDVDSLLQGKVQRDEVEEATRQLQILSRQSGIDFHTRADILRHKQMIDWLGHADSRYGDPDPGVTFGAECFEKQPVSIGQYFSNEFTNCKPESVTPVRTVPTEVIKLGSSDSAPTKVSVVLEGGGGKGQAFAESLKLAMNGLDQAESQGFEIDEFSGTSAGALTAGFLAAGFDPDELADVLKQLDPLKFNSDGITLMGGTNPMVGGINRTGLFSMQKMYRELYCRLSERLGVEGRPILFSDFPHKLSVVTTVASTNLPQDDPLRKLIDDDGRMVLSREHTPHFDAVAAIISSAAVPGFFQSPITEVSRKDAATGEHKMYQIQFCDGGVIENLPISTTSQNKGESRSVVAVPVRYNSVDSRGKETARLNTLDFSGSALEAVNEENRELYSEMIPEMTKFLSEAKVDRAVLAFDLASEEELAQPAVLGSNRALTHQLHQTATASGFSVLSESKSRKFFETSQHKPTKMGNAVGTLFDMFLDGKGPADGNRLRKVDGRQTVRVDTEEIDTLYDTVGATLASTIAASVEYEERRFEAPIEWNITT